MSWLRGLVVVVVLLLVGAFLGSTVSQWWSEAPSLPRTAVPERAVEGRVRVEVLNGGGIQGRARDATQQLRDAGFDVVFFGNAGTFDHDSSLVLDRVDRVEGARAVADVLGIRNVRSEPDSNLYLDVTVVLGREWAPAPRPADLAAPQASPDRPWWDPRGWIRR